MPPQLFDASGPITETKRFLPRAKMSWAENILLSHPYARSKTHLALINCIEPDLKANERGRLASTCLRSHTFEELYIEVAKAASGLRRLGIGVGDRVAAFTPNNAEAVVLVIATSSIGAIWSSVSPEFGVNSVLERFVQVSDSSFMVMCQ